MEDILYQLNFIEYLNDVINNNYKSERFVKFIKDFDIMWKEKKYILPEDEIHRIWGTKLVADDNTEIKKLLWDPFFLKINDFFELRNKRYLYEITEDDLIDLTLCDGIGKVSFFMFMKLLFGKSNVNFDYKINTDNINTDEVIDRSINSIYESLETIKTEFANKTEEFSKQYNTEKQKSSIFELQLKRREAELNILKCELADEKSKNKIQVKELLTDISNAYEMKKELEKELVQLKEKNNYLDNEIKKKINELLEKENSVISLQNEIEAHKQTIAEFSSLKGMVEHILDKFRKNTQSND